MEEKIILSKVDHTLLGIASTWEDIQKTLDDAIEYGAATACIPPCYVKQACEYVQGKLPICTVIGFPNGYNTTEVKCFEATQAVKEGAEEIDMVIRIAWVKEGRYDLLENEIRQVKAACLGKTLKVIVETCQLTNEEKAKMCAVVANAGADFIKTSTGFSTGGATFEDVEIFAKNRPEGLKIKAAGGIKDMSDAEHFIELGADRLGTSRLVKILKSRTQESCR